MYIEDILKTNALADDIFNCKLIRRLYKITNGIFYPVKKFVVTRYISHDHSWIHAKNSFSSGKKFECLSKIVK